MPAPLQEFIEPSAQALIQVAMEPARIAIHSLMLISKYDHKPGLAAWIGETKELMTAEELQVNELVLTGFHYAVVPSEVWPSFPVYVDYLSRIDPTVLRDKMMGFYNKMPVMQDVPKSEVIDEKSALKSPENYLVFLRQRFQTEFVDEELELRAYQYIIEPSSMRQIIVDHLWRMWRKYLKVEWERVRPMLHETVRAFQQFDLSPMSFEAAYEFVTGREPTDEKWSCLLEDATRMVFIPHPHVGPYILRGHSLNDTLYIFFSPRLPKGAAVEAPDLSRTEIAVRLSALADDTRLRILRYIAENGEARSQEIMEVLDLSQSAVSRHLTQLSAAGYVKERRCDGAKCYALNPERVHDTLQAVSNFLLVPERSEI